MDTQAFDRLHVAFVRWSSAAVAAALAALFASTAQAPQPQLQEIGGRLCLVQTDAVLPDSAELPGCLPVLARAFPMRRRS